MANTQPDQDPKVEQLIREIREGAGGGHQREANKASLEVIHIAKVSGALKELTDAIFSAQRIIGERITELNVQIDETRKGLHESSKAASEHSHALVNWTKKSVRITFAYVVLTAGLLGVATCQSVIAQRALQAQVEPQVSLEIEGLGGPSQLLSVSNEGAFPVVEISIYYDTLLFWGPPWHQDTRGIYRLPQSRSPGWWHIEKLGPGEVQTHSMDDPTREALDFAKQMNSHKSAGKLPDVPTSAIFSPQLLHHMKFYREADRKVFRKELAVFVVRNDEGKPYILPPGQIPYITIPSSVEKGKAK